jgi:hypothetical protein
MYNDGRRVRLTTLPPSVSGLSRQCGILNISQTYRPPRLYSYLYSTRADARISPVICSLLGKKCHSIDRLSPGELQIYGVYRETASVV